MESVIWRAPLKPSGILINLRFNTIKNRTHGIGKSKLLYIQRMPKNSKYGRHRIFGMFFTLIFQKWKSVSRKLFSFCVDLTCFQWWAISKVIHTVSWTECNLCWKIIFWGFLVEYSKFADLAIELILRQISRISVKLNWFTFKIYLCGTPSGIYVKTSFSWWF